MKRQLKVVNDNKTWIEKTYEEEKKKIEDAQKFIVDELKLINDGDKELPAATKSAITT